MSPRATARQRPTPPSTVHAPRQDADETADLSGHSEETADLSGAEGLSGHAGGAGGLSGQAEETAELSGLIGSRAGARLASPTDPERRRPRTGLAFGAIGLAVVVAGGAGTVAARRAATTTAGWTAAQPASTAQADVVAQAAPSPSPSDVALPARYTVPGTPPAIPWPTTGQAALRVVGVGSLGATPDQSQVPIASVAKAMTAYVVLHDHPLSAGSSGPTLTVTGAEAAAYPDEVAKGQSLVKVTAGEVLTERQALDALMLPSADNVALILARWDAGSVPSFVSKMNTTAAALGMTHTDYTDPSGYEPSTVSTANDQILLAARVMQVPAFAQIVAERSASVPLAGTVHNYNTLLGSDGVTGIKTGSTSAAGGCLLFAANYQVGGTTVTIVGATFGQHGSTMYGLPQALDESRTLIQTAQQALGSFPLIAAGQTVVTVHGMNLAATGTLTVIGWPGLEFRPHLHTNANLRPGADAGTLELDGPESHQTADLTVQ
jgi:D-alanyl-D-alanine carboxypeptidase (penicillin-binding protein 5/6)